MDLCSDELGADCGDPGKYRCMGSSARRLSSVAICETSHLAYLLPRRRPLFCPSQLNDFASNALVGPDVVPALGARYVLAIARCLVVNIVLGCLSPRISLFLLRA